MIEVLKLYCRTPFGRLHSRNPEIVSLANTIGRTPGAVALKATNFASLDPSLSQKGMGNASALDKIVWDEFFADMDKYVTPKDAIEKFDGFEEAAQARFLADLPIGTDFVTTSKVRKNQGFFRDMILASYETRCALTDISTSELLVASHIVPWAFDQKLRMDPHNGICLNALHDRAFDRGLISFSDDLSVIYSSKLSSDAAVKLREITNDRLKLPRRFRPNSGFLQHHRTQIFKT